MFILIKNAHFKFKDKLAQRLSDQNVSSLKISSNKWVFITNIHCLVGIFKFFESFEVFSKILALEKSSLYNDFYDDVLMDKFYACYQKHGNLVDIQKLVENIEIFGMVKLTSKPIYPELNIKKNCECGLCDRKSLLASEIMSIRADKRNCTKVQNFNSSLKYSGSKSTEKENDKNVDTEGTILEIKTRSQNSGELLCLNLLATQKSRSLERILKSPVKRTTDSSDSKKPQSDSSHPEIDSESDSDSVSLLVDRGGPFKMKVGFIVSFVCVCVCVFSFHFNLVYVCSFDFLFHCMIFQINLCFILYPFCQILGGDNKVS